MVPLLPNMTCKSNKTISGANKLRLVLCEIRLFDLSPGLVFAPLYTLLCDALQGGAQSDATWQLSLRVCVFLDALKTSHLGLSHT